MFSYASSKSPSHKNRWPSWPKPVPLNLNTDTSKVWPLNRPTHPYPDTEKKVWHLMKIWDTYWKNGTPKENMGHLMTPNQSQMYTVHFVGKLYKSNRDSFCLIEYFEKKFFEIPIVWFLPENFQPQNIKFGFFLPTKYQRINKNQEKSCLPHLGRLRIGST